MNNPNRYYNVSIIMPYFKKKNELQFSLPLNYPYFSQKGVELILVVDEPASISEFDFLSDYPLLQYKIMVNNTPHSWRNPSKAINVGIRHANRKYILVMSPESIFAGNVIALMRDAYLEQSYVTGFVHFILYDDYMKNPAIILNTKSVNYGSIFVKREDLINVGGYNEDFISWGCDDDEIRFRLNYYGFRNIVSENIKLVHIDLKERENIQSRVKNEQFLKQREMAKKINIINFENNGLDFEEILIDKTNCVGQTSIVNFPSKQKLINKINKKTSMKQSSVKKL